MPDTIVAEDGTPLHVHRWPGDARRGTVLVVHGLGEHGGRYAHVAAWLAARGFAACGYDHRGHGLSGGARGVLPREDAMVRDLERVVDALRPSRGPLILLAHSMGGAVGGRFVAEGRRPVDALILSSPALKAPLSALQRIQLAIGRVLAPSLVQGNGINAVDISHDAEVVRRYVEDPLDHDRVSARLAQSILHAGALTLAAAARWTVPTLLIYAGADRLVDPAGSDAFAASAPVGTVESERFAGLYHEILNEGALAAPVYARLERWLDARFPR